MYFRILNKDLSMATNTGKAVYKPGEVFAAHCTSPILKLMNTGRIEVVEPIELISAAQDAINAVYRVGALDWVQKRRPTLYKEICRAEELLNTAALGNGNNMLPYLQRYRELWFYAIRQYKEHLDNKARARKAKTA